MKSFFISRKLEGPTYFLVTVLTIVAIVLLLLGKKGLAEAAILIAGVVNIFYVFSRIRLERKMKDKTVRIIDESIVIDDKYNAYMIHPRCFLSFVIFIVFMAYGYKQEMFGFDFETFLLFGLLVLLSIHTSVQFLKLEFLKKNNNVLYKNLNRFNIWFSSKKIEIKTKYSDTSYLAVFPNGKSQKIWFIESYDNYNDLIASVDGLVEEVVDNGSNIKDDTL